MVVVVVVVGCVTVTSFPTVIVTVEPLLELPVGRRLREDEAVLGRVGDVLLDHRHRQPGLLEPLLGGVDVVPGHGRDVDHLRPLRDGERHGRAVRHRRAGAGALRDDLIDLGGVGHVRPARPLNPAPLSCPAAFSYGWPTTPGTPTCFGPVETFTSTVEPTSTVVPLPGLDAVTAPSATVEDGT